MKFNRGNYELYVIDFLEGNLSEEDHILFLKFLQDNPVINEEIKDIHNVQLQSGDEHFPGKKFLKKNISTSKYQDDLYNYCVSYLEGDIKSAEKINFENRISNNPDEANELELFRKVYLKADMSIIFNQKSRLKKRSIVQNRIRLFSILTTAAAVIIFLIIFIRPSGIINRNVISKSSNNDLKSTTEKEIITEETEQINVETGKEKEQQSKDEPLAESELDNIKVKKEAIDSQKKFTSTDSNYSNINTSIKQGAGSMERISMKPVSSLLAYVKTESSIHISGLRQSDPGEVRNFDEYKTIREYVNKNILSDFFSADESDKQEKLTFWNMASNSLEGINSITDGGYALDKETAKQV